MPSALLHVQAVVSAAEKAPAGLPVMGPCLKMGSTGLSRETNAASGAGLVSLLNLFPPKEAQPEEKILQARDLSGGARCFVRKTNGVAGNDE